MYARLSIFTDYGQTFYANAPKGVAPRVDLLGAGLGLNVTIGTHFDMRVSWGIALNDVPGWSAGKSRASFAVGYQF